MQQSGILDLKYPVIGLSPMDGVTDSAYRFITKKYGNPDIIFTEFTNVMGLSLAGHNVVKDFHYDTSQKPIVAQIYGKEPEYFYHAAKIACELRFNAVDINMGCPAKNVASSGSGAALIKTPELALEIIAATKEGVKHWAENGELTGIPEKTKKAVYKLKSEMNITDESRQILPVSVKTRTGYSEPTTEWWITTLATAKPAWISLHGRTLKQMYTGSSNWLEIKKAVEVTDIPILGNGDIKHPDDVKRMLELTNAKGVLVGKATYGNPWFFSGKDEADITKEDRINVLIEHTTKFVELNPSEGAFVQMRKHFGWYIKGFDGAKELRMQLMQANSLEDLYKIFRL